MGFAQYLQHNKNDSLILKFTNRTLFVSLLISLKAKDKKKLIFDSFLIVSISKKKFTKISTT